MVFGGFVLEEEVSELRNPFGMYKGELITINDVPEGMNGEKCGCTCPACDGAFLARMGQERVKHFAHKGDACDEIKAYLMGLYMLLFDFLNKGKTIHLPSLYLSFSMEKNYNIPDANLQVCFDSQPSRIASCSFGEIQILADSEIVFDSAKICYDKDNVWPESVIAFKGTKAIAFVIRPPDTICTITPSIKQYKDYSTLQVDFVDPDLFAKNTKEDIFAPQICR